MNAAISLPVLMLALIGVAGCGAPPDRGTVAQQAACRERADEVYLRQNRAEIYRADQYATSTRDAPYGSSGVIGNTSSGLSGRYARDSMVSDCIAGAVNAATPGPGKTPDEPAVPAPPAASAKAPRPTRP